MSKTTQRTPFSLLRTAIEAIAVFGILLLICQTWALDGFLRPYTISGPSMACTLLGEHRQVVCGDCGIEFSCDSSFWPVSPRAVCPNCGFVDNDLESPPDLSGERVLIDRSAYEFRSPRRWEVVAFRPPQRAEGLAIKRAVGLPGETVEIRHGDVYIDGHIVRKPLAVQLTMAVAVDDANYASPKLPPRWKGESSASLWSMVENKEKGKRRFVFKDFKIGDISDLPIASTIDWLVYRHCRRVVGEEGRTEAVPVEDTMAYNQNRPRRVEDVHAVSDLLLSFKLTKTSSNGKFLIRATEGQAVFRVELDFAKNSVAVFQNDLPLDVAEKNLPVLPLKNDIQITISFFDRQFLLAFDDQPILAFPLAEDVKELSATAEPFALGSQNLEAVVDDLRVFRDVYYCEPIGRIPWGWSGNPCHLGEDSYYVLGDNSSISEDSRTWGPSGKVFANSLLGKPLVVVFPPRPCSPFGRRFQIPDFRRIRYIR